MATSQEQINKLKRELRLTKDRYEDLSRELQDKENHLLQMEDVIFFYDHRSLYITRKEIDIEMN